MLQAALKAGPAKAASVSEYLDDVIHDLVAYYQVAGIQDYDWKPLGANSKDADWDYVGFDMKTPYKLRPAARLPKKRSAARGRACYCCT